MKCFCVAILCLMLAVIVSASPEPAQAGFKRYIAASSTCPGAANASASLARQERTMRCLVNYARKRKSLRTLRKSTGLERSSASKMYAIRRCDDFSHTACGRSFISSFRAAGYMNGSSSWSVGENIAWWSPASHAQPRKIFEAWLDSPGHRQNIFRDDWREQGVRAVRSVSFEGARDTIIWVSQFGYRR